MLKGFNENGELKNVIVTDEGEILVKMSGGGGQSGTQQSEIVNTSENPVPVNITNERETTLYASVEDVSSTATTISINKKVTSIDVANYSDDNSVTITIGQLEFEIGNNISTTLEINANVTDISLEATQNTKLQIIVKGVN